MNTLIFRAYAGLRYQRIFLLPALANSGNLSAVTHVPGTQGSQAIGAGTTATTTRLALNLKVLKEVTLKCPSTKVWLGCVPLSWRTTPLNTLQVMNTLPQAEKKTQVPALTGFFYNTAWPRQITIFRNLVQQGTEKWCVCSSEPGSAPQIAQSKTKLHGLQPGKVSGNAHKQAVFKASARWNKACRSICPWLCIEQPGR